MGILDWLFREPRFRRFEDSYAIDSSAQLDGLRQAIAKQAKATDSIWVVVHFTDTFLTLQSFLESNQIEYSVAQDLDDLVGDLDGQPPATNDAIVANPGHAYVTLVMSSLLTNQAASFAISDLQKQRPQNTKLAVMVCERHPLPALDAAIVNFVKCLPVTITLGYLLSLEDCVVCQVVSPVTRTVLHNLGMNNRELVASNFVTRRLDRVLARQKDQFASPPQPADNAEDWIQQNQMPDSSSDVRS